MIDFERLENAVLGVLSDDISERYDMSIILKTAELVWDDTAVQVRSNDFLMIFDLVTYELQDYNGFDAS